MSDKKTFKCAICGYESAGYGNNPYPLASDNKKCCDMCNMMYVIPARIKMMSVSNKRG